MPVDIRMADGRVQNARVALLPYIIARHLFYGISMLENYKKGTPTRLAFLFSILSYRTLPKALPLLFRTGLTGRAAPQWRRCIPAVRYRSTKAAYEAPFPQSCPNQNKTLKKNSACDAAFCIASPWSGYRFRIAHNGPLQYWSSPDVAPPAAIASHGSFFSPVHRYAAGSVQDILAAVKPGGRLPSIRLSPQ